MRIGWSFSDDKDDRVKQFVEVLYALNCPVFGDNDYDVDEYFEQLEKTTAYGPAKMMAEIHHHARLGSLGAIRAAVAAGVDVNGQDEFDSTPLHCAIAEKQAAAAMLLLGLGADPRIPDEDGSTAAHYAVVHKLPAVLDALLTTYPDVASLSDKHGNQPLWTAAFNARGNYELVSILLRHGADSCHRNRVNLAPIDFARRIADPVLLELLEGKS